MKDEELRQRILNLESRLRLEVQELKRTRDDREEKVIQRIQLHEESIDIARNRLLELGARVAALEENLEDKP